MAAEQPPWEQCSQDSCTGVRLPATAWCLAHAAEQAPDAFDAELKRISAEGSVDARGVVISAELLERLLVAVPRKGDRPTFTAARFDWASFQEGAEFGWAIFQGEAEFDGAIFQGEAEFDGAIFQGKADFGEVSFQERAGFSETSFKGGAMFVGASFQGEAWFDRASFQGEAWFDRVSFQGEAWFDRAIFRGGAGFDGATFRGGAGFDRVSFQGGAGFIAASFEKGAAFFGASFQGGAAFSGASFQVVAVFGETSFKGEAGFDGASFKGEADFDRASFQERAGFDRASFEHETHIGPLLARQLVLDGAVFGARVQLDVTAAALCARRAQFPAGVHLRLRYATVDLEGADLSAPAILAGAPSPFSFQLPWVDRQEAQLARGWERLPPGPRQQRWRPRLLSVRRADVAGLRLADVDLRACRFAGAHNLDRLRIEGAPLFCPHPRLVAGATQDPGRGAALARHPPWSLATGRLVSAGVPAPRLP